MYFLFLLYFLLKGGHLAVPQLARIYCSTYTYVWWKHIVLEAVPGQLPIYIWVQARNWIGLQRSFPAQFWSGSVSTSRSACKSWHGYGPKDTRLQSNYWTYTTGLGTGKKIWTQLIVWCPFNLLKNVHKFPNCFVHLVFHAVCNCGITLPIQHNLPLESLPLPHMPLSLPMCSSI